MWQRPALALRGPQSTAVPNASCSMSGKPGPLLPAGNALSWCKPKNLKKAFSNQPHFPSVVII